MKTSFLPMLGSAGHSAPKPINPAGLPVEFVSCAGGLRAAAGLAERAAGARFMRRAE